jgi:hypothetical protein
VYKVLVDKKIAALLGGKSKLSDKRVDNLIVSLTSFPQRINEIKYTIYSLLDQTVLPEKIVLWLAESQFPNKERDLPDELLAFKRFGLVINWCEDLKSYKKLIPVLEQFPDHCVVVADDDIYYKKRWLEKLWLGHLKHPDDVVCHKAQKILFEDGEVLPYAEWKNPFSCEDARYQTFGVGAGGVLYRKKYLYKDVGEKDLFLKLAPHADDIWFYVMTILGNTKIRAVKNPYVRLKYADPYREYGLSDGYRLSSVNVDTGLNDRQFKDVLSYYGLDLRSLIDGK